MKVDLNRGLYQVLPKKEQQPADPREAAKLKDACSQFEALFLYQIMEKARESLPKSDFSGNSMGEQVFRSMLNQELSLGMAKAGGIGLGQLLYNQLAQGLKTAEDSQKDS